MATNYPWRIVTIAACLIVATYSIAFSTGYMHAPPEYTMAIQIAGLAAVCAAAFIIFSERPDVEKIEPSYPASRADLVYASGRQPGQNWRDRVNCFRHIDPGRRMI